MCPVPLDLNRDCDELVRPIEGARGASHNPRVSSGLGVIPSGQTAGRSIGKMPSPSQGALQSIGTPIMQSCNPCWMMRRPVLARLSSDCHSMPHEAIDQTSGQRPEIVLGIVLCGLQH